MKIAYIIIFLIFAYAAVTYGRFLYVLSHAKLEEFKREEKVIGNGPKLKYIAAGDSTAVGVGASSVDNTYTDRIANHLAQSRQVQYKNIAQGGFKTKDVVETSLNKIIEFNPDVVTISIGANDLTHLVRSQNIIANYKTILDKLVSETQAKIYITDIPAVDTADLLPYPYRKFLEYRANNINSQLHKLETDQIRVINIHDFGWDSYPDLSVTFASDRFHPNDEGYNNWTNAFLSKIRLDYP